MTSFFALSSPRGPPATAERRHKIPEKPRFTEFLRKDFWSAIFQARHRHVSLQHSAWLLITLLLQIFLILLFTNYPPRQFSFSTISTTPQPLLQQALPPPPPLLPAEQYCNSGLVYVYELPPVFNKELLDNCDDLDPWISRCTALSHNGLGPEAKGLFSDNIVPRGLTPTWYWTDMFAGEVIYHSRISNYKCRTTDPESATAFYLPFYAGLAVGKFLFTNYTATERDWHSQKLNSWIQEQPFWKRSNGSDHFIMLGRMTWDFRRSKDEDWGSSFLNMPAMKEVLRLSVERSPWDELEISVPYPTGFHPRSSSDIEEWQKFVRERKRRSLFTFVGGKRKRISNDFRTLLQNHCHKEIGSCRVVDCSKLPCNDGTWAILEAFLDSNFCLQPRGDAYTRKSMFDCLLAGSIPVFFWERSIRGQYEWFLTDKPESFSVFIDRNDVRNGTSIRRVLEGYNPEDVSRMREKVISLIPRFVYSLSGNGVVVDDAFDIAIEGVLKRFKDQRIHKVENLEFQAN